MLNILGNQNRTIAELNTNADSIFAQLANRREDVVHFIDNAGRTAAISAERSNDLAQNFHLLDDFLAQLKPTMFQLGRLADAQTPLMTDLHAAAPGLNTLAKNLPPFNNGARESLTSLAGAAHVGKVALGNAKDEIAALDQSSTKAYPAANEIAKFLESIDNPANAVEEDSCARFDLRQQPGEADRRVQALDQKMGVTLHGDQTAQCKWANGQQPGPNPSGGNPGYTGMEGLLNYAYVQTNSLNLFDELGHALGITLVSAPGTNNACGYQTGPQVPDLQGSGGNTNLTNDPKNFAECAGILGDRQPGINYGTNPSGLFGNLGRYDPSVCPRARTLPRSAIRLIAARERLPALGHDCTGSSTATGGTADAARKSEGPPEDPAAGGQARTSCPTRSKKQLQDLLPQLPQVPTLPQPPQVGSGSGSSPTDNILNFLSRPMNGRGRVGSLAASPTMVGAITTLIILVAVFLAYNANNGLPFVPTYKVSAEICDAARLGPNNEVRIGGNRVGVVESIDTVPRRRTAVARRRTAPGLDRREAQPEARQERGSDTRRLDGPGPLPLLLRPQVPGDQPRHERARACPRAARCRVSQSQQQVEFDDVYNTFDTATREKSRAFCRGSATRSPRAALR